MNVQQAHEIYQELVAVFEHIRASEAQTLDQGELERLLEAEHAVSNAIYEVGQLELELEANQKEAR